MRLNTRRPSIYTHEGATASHINPVQQIRRLVLANLLWEDQFYVDGKSNADILADCCRRVDPPIILSTALEARSVWNLRHVPLLLVVQAIRNGAKGSGVSRAITEIIQRPDEIAELLSIYWKDKRQPLSAQLKKGIAGAFEKFSTHALNKYANIGEIVRMRDAMFLTHPNPKRSKGGEETFKAIAEGEAGAKDANTWEYRLSKGEDKKTVFESMLLHEELGYFALLRNLRNMVDAGVNRELIAKAIRARKNGAERILPFRFISAVRAAPSLAGPLNEAMLESIKGSDRFDGTTAILVDVSGSMWYGNVSAKSDLMRADAAAALAVLFPGEARVFSFSNNLIEVPRFEGLPGIQYIHNSQPHDGTRLGLAVATLVTKYKGFDRIIVITDEQSQDKLGPTPINKKYMINVAAYEHGINYGDWIHLTGFSESIFKFIKAFEADNG